MMLTNKQIKFLKSKAHHLKPIVWIGEKGLSETLLKEIIDQLEIHELMKIKLNYHGTEKKAMAQEVVVKTESNYVSLIGKTLILYKPAAEPKLVIPQN
jgi:RNA-binding protein